MNSKTLYMSMISSYPLTEHTLNSLSKEFYGDIKECWQSIFSKFLRFNEAWVLIKLSLVLALQDYSDKYCISVHMLKCSWPLQWRSIGQRSCKEGWRLNCVYDMRYHIQALSTSLQQSYTQRGRISHLKQKSSDKTTNMY